MTANTAFEDTRGRFDDDAPIVADSIESSDGGSATIVEAATLRGQSVVNTSGEDLGKIEAVMLDVSEGRIAYAVLSSGGFIGIGNKLLAIPWSALTVDEARTRLVLDASKEQLESAPAFERNRWPSMEDRNWANEIHTYYEASPYWDDPLSASSG